MIHRPLPGDRPAHDIVRRMIRVNHAGEYGAVRIYAGQQRALAGSSVSTELAHMAAQEQGHLDQFSTLLRDRHIPPTRFEPLWHILGYGLGYITGKMGSDVAMACTVAIEEVIDDHYASQEKILENIKEEDNLKTLIQQCRADEREHKITGLNHGAANAPLFPIVTGVIRGFSRAAIWLSTRL